MEIVVKRKYIDSSRVESHGIPIKCLNGRNAVHAELVKHLAEHGLWLVARGTKSAERFCFIGNFREISYETKKEKLLSFSFSRRQPDLNW
ncbi:hypothetical protein [[Clostridium] aminophilum]|uniref:hypothetical protein n=1 Tax=[Clostridium] aminophilum TaxID=1526 RepID=UPI0009459611|nr:hypothetical protein [[Clostridium] aminophilum]